MNWQEFIKYALVGLLLLVLSSIPYIGVAVVLIVFVVGFVAVSNLIVRILDTLEHKDDQ